VSQVTLGELVKWLAGSGPERQRPPVASYPWGRACRARAECV